MHSGRSNYNINFNCDQITINNLIQSFLQANGFSIFEKKGEQYYKSGDSSSGYRAFKYTINNNVLNIQAWMDGLYEITIDNNNLNSYVVDYRLVLQQLFIEIDKLNNTNADTANQGTMQVNAGFSQTFKNETLKKQEKLCEIGFWLSILSLLAVLFGAGFGFIDFVALYLGYYGLETKKRKKAIATIIISSLTLLLAIILLFTGGFVSE